MIEVCRLCQFQTLINPSYVNIIHASYFMPFKVFFLFFVFLKNNQSKKLKVHWFWTLQKSQGGTQYHLFLQENPAWALSKICTGILKESSQELLPRTWVFGTNDKLHNRIMRAILSLNDDTVILV